MSVLVNILTTYNGVGAKRAMRDMALMQRQANLAGRGMTASMLGASAGMVRAGNSMAGTGKMLSKYITLPVLAVGAVSLKMAADFESSMKLIQTQCGGTADDVKQLSRAVLDLAPSTSKGPMELSKALYHLKSVGMDNRAAMEALKVATQGASVGQADLEQTADALAGAWKTGVKGAKTFEQAMGTLNASIGAGNMRMEDMTAALGTGILTTAKTFGVSFGSVGAAIATFTAQGQPAVQSATRLRMAISMMAAPTDKAKAALESIGLKSDDLARALKHGGIVEAVGLLKDHLKGLSEIKAGQTIAAAFGGARGGGTIMSLVQGYDTLVAKQDQITKSAGNFGSAVAANAQRVSASWGKIKSTFQTISIQIGNALMPVAKQISAELLQVSQAFARLSPSTRTWIVKLAVLAAVVGPVLVITGKLVVGIGRTVGAIGKLSLAMGRGAAAAPRWARALAGIPKGLSAAGRWIGSTTVAIGRQTVALARAAAAWAAHAAKQASYTLMGIRLMAQEAASKAAATAATIAHTVAAKAAAAAQWLLNAAMSANPVLLIVLAITALVGVFVLLWKKCDWFRNFWIAVWERVKSAAMAVWPVLKKVGQKIVAALGFIWDKVYAAVEWFWGWAGPYIKAAIRVWWAQIKLTAKLIVAVVKALWKAVSAAVTWFWGWAGPFIKGALKQWWAQFKATMTVIVAVVRTAWGVIKAVVGAAVKAIGVIIRGVQANIAIVRAAWNAIRSVTSAAWAAISGLVSSAWSRIAGAVSAGVSKVIGLVKGLGARLKGALNLASTLYNAGQDLVRGLLNGISAAWHWVTDKLSSLVSSLSSAAKKALGINSPSRVFAEIGASIGEGLSKGIVDGSGRVSRAMLDLTGATIPAGGGPRAYGAALPTGGRRSGSVYVARGAVSVTVGRGDGGAGPSLREVQSVVDRSFRQLLAEIGRR